MQRPIREVARVSESQVYYFIFFYNGWREGRFGWEETVTEYAKVNDLPMVIHGSTSSLKISVLNGKEVSKILGEFLPLCSWNILFLIDWEMKAS